MSTGRRWGRECDGATIRFPLLTFAGPASISVLKSGSGLVRPWPVGIPVQIAIFSDNDNVTHEEICELG